MYDHKVVKHGIFMENKILFTSSLVLRIDPSQRWSPVGGHALLKLKKLEWDADEREKKRKKNKKNMHKFLSKASRGL